MTRELHVALSDVPGLDVTAYSGGGDLRPDEKAVWNLPRTSAMAHAVSRLTDRGPYFVEQMTFFAGFLPQLLAWQPHVIYFADLNFGNACWHWRRLTGQRYRLLYQNSGPTTRPFTRCDLVQQVSPVHFEAALERGESPERMCVLPYGFDLPSVLAARNAARVEATRNALGVPPGRKLLLSVGMLGPTLKRMDTLVEAVADLGDDRPYLALLGQASDETPALVARAHALLGDGVRFATWPRERIGDAYEAADAFALMSISEGFGLVYVEALAAGLPCAVHDSPNARYIFGPHAFLGDTTSAKAAVSLLRRTLSAGSDEDDRRFRHRWAYEHFSWNALRPRYVELLHACAEGRRPQWADA